MNDLENQFREISKGKRGRPAAKKPVGESAQDKPAVGATSRKPVGLRKRTSAPTREGFYRRWVNDTEDRIQIFEEGGYSSVKGEDGTPRTRRIGGGKKAILMEIDRELYEQDQQIKYHKWNRDNQERLKPREGTGYYQPKSKM